MDRVDVGFCSNLNHSIARCGYARDNVPIQMMKQGNGALAKQCSVCRLFESSRSKVARARRKTAISAISKDRKVCFQCHSEYVDEKGQYIHCVECRRKKHVQNDGRLKHAYRTVILQRIRAMGTCCAICQKIFLKTANGIGFATVDSMDGICDTELELSNLEFDHLTESEQIARFGTSTGPKKDGVARMRSLQSMNTEAAKCQLVCLLCHLRETIRRRAGLTVFRPHVILKRYHVENTKLEIAACQECNAEVKQEITEYHEFDHLDPQTKIAGISEMCYGTHTLDDVKKEIAKCRLLCKFCHRRHTSTMKRLNGVFGSAP